jgi:hypothetical protein
MSSPTDGAAISFRPGAVTALAAELAALGGELSDDAALCRAAAASLYAALSADEGWAAGSAATAWATLTDAVADRSAAVAATLLGALAAYSTADASLASRITQGTGAGQVGGR